MRDLHDPNQLLLAVKIGAAWPVWTSCLEGIGAIDLKADTGKPVV